MSKIVNLKKMKKYFVSLVVLGSMLFFAADVCAHEPLSGKQLDKAVKKSVKDQLKYLKKGNWNLTGTSLPLEVALDRHYRTLLGTNSEEIEANVGMCQSLNVCSSQAQNNALIEYARSQGSSVEGQANVELFNNASAARPKEVDAFLANYQTNVSQEIKGEVKISIAFERSVKKTGGGREYKAYFLIDADKAVESRMRAFQQAAREANLSKEYVDKFSEYVRQGSER